MLAKPQGPFFSSFFFVGSFFKTFYTWALCGAGNAKLDFAWWFDIKFSFHYLYSVVCVPDLHLWIQLVLSTFKYTIISIGHREITVWPTEQVLATNSRCSTTSTWHIQAQYRNYIWGKQRRSALVLHTIK